MSTHSDAEEAGPARLALLFAEPLVYSPGRNAQGRHIVKDASAALADLKIAKEVPCHYL